MQSRTHGPERKIQFWSHCVWFSPLSASKINEKGVNTAKTQVRKELADQREKVKGIREELAREKLKLAQALVETMGEVEAFKPLGA